MTPEEELDFKDDEEQETSDSEHDSDLDQQFETVVEVPKEKLAVESGDWSVMKQHPDFPQFQELMQRMFNETLEKNKTVKLPNEGGAKPKTKTNKGIAKKKAIETNLTSQVTPFKSTSDSTVYVPALQQKRFDRSPKANENLEVVSRFVESLRMCDFPGDGKQTSVSVGERPGTSGEEPKQKDEQRQRAESLKEANERAERHILQAERYKATIEAPHGKELIQNLNKVPNVDLCFNDDQAEDFLQVTCHIDDSVKDKAEQGGFIEMQILSPKLRIGQVDDSMEGGLEMVNRDGKTFFVPCNEQQRSSQKITSYRKWEQSFRVYMALYTKANPLRGHELIQYMHTISIAASSFHWDNVMYYDYMFRKMMEKNPQRSWAKTNTQLWTLAMRDPIASKNHSQFAENKNRGSKNGEFKNACWRHNRNQCKNSAASCRFEHRCSFCGAYNHIYLNCPRRPNRGGSSKEAEQGKERSGKHKKERAE